jgi:hypothetical protein
MRPSLRLFGALISLALAAAAAVEVTIALLWPQVLPSGLAERVADFSVPHYTVAGLLAKAPAAGRSVDVDAYLSPAGQPLCGTAAQVVLADEPFAAELSLLGTRLPNALPQGGWLAAAGAPSPLPYRARLRGHLEAAGASGCAGTPVFTIERVVRVYAASAPAAASSAWPTWPRHEEAGEGYSVPLPPGWHVEGGRGQPLTLRAKQGPSASISIATYPGETHHDPYEPEPGPALLQGRRWSLFEQATALGPGSPATQGLAGYRIERAEEGGGRTTSVLFSAHGRTYELSLHYGLGLGLWQPALDAFSGVVAGFGLAAPPEPSPTPPVRQALGAGPFLRQEQALAAGCGCLNQEIDAVLEQRLVSEAQARQLGGPCAGFRGHTDGVWALAVKTPLAKRTGALRLFLDAATGRELCREEIDARALPTPAPEMPSSAQMPPPGARPPKWIEVDLSQQTVTAWEGDNPVRRFPISSGTASYPTVTGNFHIYRKMTALDMRGPGYYLPNVPWVMLFFEGYALHGAYWHFSFGTPISHGCVNMTIPDAAWLFQWTDPHLGDGQSDVISTPCNPGTLVVVHP